MVLPQATGHAAASLSSSRNELRLCRKDPFNKSRIPSIADLTTTLQPTFIETQSPQVAH
jgi:hypothetical protein